MKEPDHRSGSTAVWPLEDSLENDFIFCLELTYNGGGLVAKSCLTLAIPWTIACQALLPMVFSGQEYWSELPFPSPGDLPNSGIESGSPTLQEDSSSFFFFKTSQVQ